jgi:hypothetical protein
MKETDILCPPEEQRRQLLLLNREQIEYAYEKAVSKGVDDPVVLVLDLRDERAVYLALRAGLSMDFIDAWREKCYANGVVPTQIFSAPRWAAILTIGPLTPKSTFGISKPNPPNTFRVAAISAGGNVFADFPMPTDQ